MKKRLMMCLLGLGIVSASMAQSDYDRSIGVRFGSAYFSNASVSYKAFLDNGHAIELNGGFGFNNAFSISAAGAYQIHNDLGDVEGLKWYYGGGLVTYTSISNKDGRSGFGLGIFPTAGLDYKINNAPIALSLDVRPTLSLVAPSYYNTFDANLGLTVRYTF